MIKNNNQHLFHLAEIDRDEWGPWHVPCTHAYLAFSSKLIPGEEESLEFTIEAESKLDQEDADRGDCGVDGVNYALGV